MLDGVSRGYDQRCAVAVAADVVAERWTPLIVRDLLVGPRRYNDLLAALPGISSNTLATRLRTLDAQGVVQRVAVPRAQGGVVYRLTERGAALEPVVVALAEWGADELRDGGRRFTHPGRPVIAALHLRRRLAEEGAPPGSAHAAVLDGTAIGLLVGADGAVESRWDAPPDAVAHLVVADNATFFDLAGGRTSFAEAEAAGTVALSGTDPAAVAALRAALEPARPA